MIFFHQCVTKNINQPCMASSQELLKKNLTAFLEAHSGELVHYESLMVLKFYISHLSGRFVITFPHVGVIPINPVPKILPLHQ